MDKRMNKKKGIAIVSENTLKIELFLSKCKIGEELSFDNIGHEAGVNMNQLGKNYLRTALKRLKLEYISIRGYGIKLADSKTTMPIVASRLTKIDKAVKRADKTHRNLQEQFFESLTPQEQKQLLFVGATFGAIRVAAENGRLMYQSKHKLTNTVTIPIPEY